MPKQPVRKHEKMQVHYETIHEFFDAFSLPQARMYLLSAIKATENDRVWKKSVPADLLYFFEKLNALVHAALILSDDDHKKNRVILPSENVPDLNVVSLYCGQLRKYAPWDYFPRSLSAKEYNNPYAALQKSNNHAGKTRWKHTLSNILSYALSENKMQENDDPLQVLQTATLLQKMIEACHLIDVRMNCISEKE